MLIIFLINTVVIVLCVAVHYEAFIRLSSLLSHLNIPHKSKVLWSFIVLLATHVIEIWIFGIAYYACIEHGGLGKLQGDIQHHLFDYVYYSFVSYTSLGLGDIIPTGPMRFMTGVESLLGLLLIAWSASFLFYQMEQHWQR